MNLQEKIKALNSQVKELNSVRQKNLGRREALMKQQEDSINAYNQKYGTSITAETVKEEYARISAEKEKEVEQLSAIITAISTGDYDKANELAGVEAPAPVSAEANDSYVEKVVESAGTVQTSGGSTPVMDNEAMKMASQAQSIAKSVAETGEFSGIKGVEPVKDKGDGSVPFAPSPLSNPLNVSTGVVKNIPEGSVFAQDFSKDDDSDDSAVAPPVAPPLANFGISNNKGSLPNAPIAPLGSLM